MKKNSLEKLNQKWWGIRRWMEIVDEADRDDVNYEVFVKVLEGYIKNFELLFQDLKGRILIGRN